MPNNVTNIIITEADLSKYNNEKGEFDFNKILPMPDGLWIQCDSLVSDIYNPYNRTQSIEYLIKEIKKAGHERIENFCQAIRNLNKTGYACWYDWSVEKWGTKWNAYNFRKISGHIAFDTAWSSPDPIFQKLSQIEPEKEIKVINVEEDHLIIYLDVFQGGKLIKQLIIGKIEWCNNTELYHFEGASDNDKDKILELVIDRA